MAKGVLGKFRLTVSRILTGLLTFFKNTAKMTNLQKTAGASHSCMSISDHLEAFRKRLIYALWGIGIGIIICLFYSPQLLLYLRQPYTSIMISEGLDPRLQSLAPSDGFTTYIKISSLSGVILASPWAFYHLWQFVAAGLYPTEKRVVHVAAPISMILFFSGVIFFIMIVAPFTLRFFILFNKKMLGVDSAFTFEKYISFITSMILVFGFAFQTPTGIFFLNRIGIVSLDTLYKSRKFVILAIFILAAIMTPPDVVSQVTLAVPLYLLFESGIVLSRFINR